MSEAERRRGYSDARVLLETSRVLDPQFSDGFLCISGAHLEMLRSLCQYLRRPGTFVTTYGDGYYLTPTTAEWDALQAIVAELEESLMGCNEVESLLTDIRGYLAGIGFDAQLLRQMATLLDANEEDAISSAGGTHEYITFTTVPEDYLVIVTGVSGHCTSAAFGPLTLEWYDGAAWRRIWREAACLVNLPYGYLGEMTLHPGQALRLDFGGTSSGNTLRGLMFAYRVEQP